MRVKWYNCHVKNGKDLLIIKDFMLHAVGTFSSHSLWFKAGKQQASKAG